MEFEVCVAALLHDIGKLISKSSEHRKAFGGFRKDESEETSAGYRHAYIGAWWLEEIAAKEFFRKNQKITNIIAHHHRRDWDSLDGETLAVILGDWLASGEREGKQEDGSQFLLNAFHLIGDEARERLYYKPCAVEDNEYFPVVKDELKSELYEKLAFRFSEVISKIVSNCKSLSRSKLYFNPLIESLYNTLFDYCWAVPAQTGRAGYEADISLFSHSKLTAAIALLVYRSLSRQELLKAVKAVAQKESTNLTKKPIFSLVVGDLSGIQNFIFNVPSKGAAKSLKGRSAYVELLGEAVARSLLKEFNLSRANLLMLGGGGFQVLAPYIGEEEFSEIVAKVERTLFKYHRTRLYLTLSKADLCIEDFLNPENYRKKVEEARLKASEVKLRKYSFVEDLFDEDKEVAGSEEEAKSKRCQVCGAPVSINELVELEEGIKICSLCNSIVKLGQRLKSEGNLLIITESNTGKGYNEVFAEFGFNFRFRNEPWDGALNFCVNRFPKKDTPWDWGKVCGIRLLPKGASPEVTFQEIAEKSRGIKKLGVLKIDVDNLGYLFGKGLGKRYTPSVVDTISNMLNLFFSFEVERVLDELSDGEEVFYLVFSGGDDCFLLGAWDRVFEAAYEIRKRFERFVSNPLVTFSAAFTLVGEKTPMIRIAELIEERLDEAKDTKSEAQPPEKDRISVIGYVMPNKKGRFSFDRLWELYALMQKHSPEDLVKKACNVGRVLYEGLFYTEPGHMELMRRIWLFGYLLRDYIRKDRLAVDLYELNQKAILESIGSKEDVWKFVYVLLRLVGFYIREEV